MGKNLPWLEGKLKAWLWLSASMGCLFRSQKAQFRRGLELLMGFFPNVNKFCYDDVIIISDITQSLFCSEIM